MALRNIFQNDHGLLRRIQRLDWVAHLVFHIKIHIDKIKIRSNHKRLIRNRHIRIHIIAYSKALDGRIHHGHLLDKWNFKMQPRLTYTGRCPESSHNRLLLLPNCIKCLAAHNKDQKHRSHNSHNLHGSP